MNDEFYKTPDPWGYKTSEVDRVRKVKILATLVKYGPYESALDIGCGEGWITTDIPATDIFGYEISEVAKSRWPKNINEHCDGYKYDLVLATGVLYSDYEFPALFGLINDTAAKYLVTCHIASREMKLEQMFSVMGFQQLQMFEFPYQRPEGDFTQRLRVFKKV